MRSVETVEEFCPGALLQAGAGPIIVYLATENATASVQLA